MLRGPIRNRDPRISHERISPEDDWGHVQGKGMIGKWRVGNFRAQPKHQIVSIILLLPAPLPLLRCAQLSDEVPKVPRQVWD